MKIKQKFFLKNLQKYGWDCGVSAVAFLLDVKGYKVSRRKIIKELNAGKSRGTDLVKIVEFFKSRPEFEVKIGQKTSFSWLKDETKKGRVVLVAYQNWQSDKDIGKPDWGHYGVIFEMVGDKVRLFDPGETTGLTEFNREDFEKRWYEDDLGVHYSKWAMSLNL